MDVGCRARTQPVRRPAGLLFRLVRSFERFVAGNRPSLRQQGIEPAGAVRRRRLVEALPDALAAPHIVAIAMQRVIRILDSANELPDDVKGLGIAG